MVHPSDLWKRDSAQSTATFSSLRSSWRSSNCRRISDDSLPVAVQPSQGNMAAAANAARDRRQPKRQMSQTSIRSTSTTDSSFSTLGKEAHEQQRPGAYSPQPRTSFNGAFDRAKDFSKSSRVDSNSSKRSSIKAPVRRCETAMQSGRHSNEWVFGGWSLRETVKAFLK